MASALELANAAPLILKRDGLDDGKGNKDTAGVSYATLGGVVFLLLASAAIGYSLWYKHKNSRYPWAKSPASSEKNPKQITQG